MRALFSVSFLSGASEKVPGSQVVVCTYKHTTKSDLMICVYKSRNVGVRSEEFIANSTLLYF